MKKMQKIAELTVTSSTDGKSDIETGREILEEAMTFALEKYEPEPGQELPKVEDFSLRESRNMGGEVVLVVFLAGAGAFGAGFAKGAGGELGKRTVAKIWDLAEQYIRNRRGRQAKVNRANEPEDTGVKSETK